MTADTERGTELRFGRAALQQLRAVLERETGPRASLLLREIGFAAGATLHQGFQDWAATRYEVESPRALDAEHLGEALSGFLSESGWGTVSLGELVPNVLALDSADWGEAGEGAAEYPSCHFSCGALADFFTRLGGTRAAVMEVECRSRGEDRCRFLVGSPDLLTYVYERMTAGMDYHQALAE